MTPDGAVRALRSGIVPLSQVRALSVGYTKLDNLLVKRLSSFRSGESLGPLFVRGEWGTGKSHLLAYVQSLALSEEIPVCILTLNARMSALNYPQRIYAQLTSGTRLQNLVGLREIFLQRMSDPQFRTILDQATARNHGTIAQCFRTLSRELSGTSEILFAISESYAWVTLLGADIAWSDYGYKREQALDRIDELATILRRCNFCGIVLLLDELETIDQLWNIRSRVNAYSVLGRLCRNANIFPVFAITERFDRVIDTDMSRGVLGDYINSDARWFLQGWKRGDWIQLRPPQFTRDSALGVVDNVVRLYRSRFPSATVSENDKNMCVSHWERNPARNPRQLIRIVVDTLDRSRELAGSGFKS